MASNAGSNNDDKLRGASGLFAAPGARQLDDFDIDLLRLLPDEGAKKGKYLHDALTVPAIKKALDPTLTSGFISVRLRMLRDEGYALTHSMLGQGGKTRGWQRTRLGKDVAFAGLGIKGAVDGGK